MNRDDVWPEDDSDDAAFDWSEQETLVLVMAQPDVARELSSRISQQLAIHEKQAAAAQSQVDKLQANMMQLGLEMATCYRGWILLDVLMSPTTQQVQRAMQLAARLAELAAQLVDMRAECDALLALAEQHMQAAKALRMAVA